MSSASFLARKKIYQKLLADGPVIAKGALHVRFHEPDPFPERSKLTFGHVKFPVDEVPQ